MARKRASPRKPGEGLEKLPLQVRLDPDVFEGLRTVADRVGISVNQYVGAVLRWAIEATNAGEPYYDADGRVQVRDQAGCFFFGSAACWEEAGDDPETGEPRHELVDKGRILGQFDFTERRVVVPVERPPTLNVSTGATPGKRRPPGEGGSGPNDGSQATRPAKSGRKKP